MSIIFIGMSSQTYNYFQAHEHSVWEIILNLQGEGYVLIGDRQYEYRPGTVFCYPPDIPHTKFSGNGFRDIYLLPSVFPLARFAKDSSPLIFQDDAEKSFETLMLLAYRAYHRQGNSGSPLVDSIFETINQLMISWMQDAPKEEDIEKLKNRLTDSFTDPEFSVSALLNTGPYCNGHLRRRFKRLTGQTPIQYLTRLRLEHAKKLMSENRLFQYSIAEIGAMSGYYDSHYFSRIFKKHEGITPAEFLKNVASPA